MLELKNVSKAVGGDKHIIDVSIAMTRGSLNVLLGPTLAGKTSLMRLMAGLDEPTSGKIIMDGKDVTGVPVRRRNVAMVYQQFINYPALTVYENIASPLRIQKQPKDVIDAKVRKAAKLMKLSDFLDRTPLNLSGGQQQRTALARAIVKDAELVLLDEPLANLDYKLREELREELPRIFAETGAIFVYATTEPHEALLLGGKTATVSNGRITQFDDTTEIYRRPHDLITARTFSDPPLNVLPVEKRGDGFKGRDGLAFAAAGSQRSLADGAYQIGIRPHHLSLKPAEGGMASLDARIALSEVTGSQSFIHADRGENRIVALVHGIHRVEPGEMIRLSFDPAKILVFSQDGRATAPARSDMAA
ncbi:ABC transporter ATP-binding protein [Fulvimarina sp. 2208YS6-2-32]|uniref:ABC transporter ATP-binding protein n=1 Tax=Fulvimarina uroteuthidis TaxID=3098149 RepID=A0ABU5I285_9HYPH|nr:ABC transporter ATP-binding protein [Fulvimarina sp. 2208YS6-2-32]MDY8109462.1 ABC transporter ATP-binding protein [Fulvimarina sp. 2208YS6-2-32]